MPTPLPTLSLFNMRLIEITSLNHPGTEPYHSLTEAQLRSGQSCDGGVFIAESPKVINVALDAGYEPLSLLCERRHITGDAAAIIERLGDKPVFTGGRDVLAAMTGYTLTRGVLCAMRRPKERNFADACRDARRVAVIDNVVEATNVGAIFRSAAALGIDAVLLTRNTCNPLCRRAVRVSMGAVFLVPWAWIDNPTQDLKPLGFKTAALALTNKSIPLGSPELAAEPRLALIMGNEGDGLPHDTIAQADYTVRIPMHHGVDSLNVAAASAVAFWEINKQG